MQKEEFLREKRLQRPVESELKRKGGALRRLQRPGGLKLREGEALSLDHFAKVAVANKRERMSERSEYGQNLSNVKPRSGRNTPKELSSDYYRPSRRLRVPPAPNVWC